MIDISTSKSISIPTAQAICVYCSASDAVADEYFAAAEALGALIGRRGDTLVYGGCKLGLMGAMARAVHRHGGKVVGIIPELIHGYGLAYTEVDELIVTPDVRERKALMEDRANAFIALPGGFGTLEEMAQVISHKHLQYHRKPVVFINTKSFYDPLLVFFEQTFEQRFAKPSARALYHVATDPASALEYIASYRETVSEEKWFTAKSD